LSATVVFSPIETAREFCRSKYNCPILRTVGGGTAATVARDGDRDRSEHFDYHSTRRACAQRRGWSAHNSKLVTTPHGRLILTVLGGLAEFERHLIIARTSEGRKRARAHGVLFGRPPKLTPHQRREAIARRDTGDETLTDIARSYNVSHSTISRL
jgi:hypothetical protein